MVGRGLLIAAVLVAGCSDPSDDGTSSATTGVEGAFSGVPGRPRCDDLTSLVGSVVTDEQWRAGCVLANGADGATPARAPCVDGRVFYAYPGGPFGFGGEVAQAGDDVTLGDDQAYLAALEACNERASGTTSP